MRLVLLGRRPPHPAACAVRHMASQKSSTVQDSEFAQRRILADVVDFAAGQVAAAAAHRLAGPVADPLLLQYGHEQGYASFLRSLSSFLTQHYRAPVAADHLMVTAGVSWALDLVCRHLAAPGDLLLLEHPTYFLAQTIINQNRLQTLPVPCDEVGVDVVKLEQLLSGSDAPRPRLLYIIPVHSNPRGRTLPLDRRQHLIRLAHRFGFTIVADEVYQLLSFPSAADPPPPMRVVEQQLFADQRGTGSGGSSSVGGASAAAEAGPSRAVAGSGPAAQASGLQAQARPERTGPLEEGCSAVVSLGSFSKIMAPGLRLGWVEASPSHLAVLRRDGVLVSGGSIAPLQAGVVHSALELQLLQDHLHNTIRPALQRQCSALCAALRQRLPESCRFHPPDGGYFVWVELPRQVESRDFLVFASARGVKFAPGPVCQGAPNCIRLSFAFYEPHDLEMGVQRLASALQAYSSKA